MITAGVTDSGVFNLETRGFGSLISPAPTDRKIQVCEPGRPFSYFSYSVVDGPKKRSNVWARLPIDGAWGYARQNAQEQADPCLIRTHEESRDVLSAPRKSLIRRWCPILFDEDLLNK